MYQITPYDLSQSFKFIPEKKKYCLLFYKGNSVNFTSKRSAKSLWRVIENAEINYREKKITLFIK